MNMIKIESLNCMWNQFKIAHHFKYIGKCSNCGSDVQIEITKTSGGYGFLGGVFCESYSKAPIALCEDCYKKSRVKTADMELNAAILF